MASWVYFPTYIDYQTGCALVVAVFLFFLYRARQRRTDLPPGPISLPLIGNILSLVFRLYSSGGEPEQILAAMSKKYGDVFSLKVGSKYIVVMNGYKSIKEAFHNPVLNDRPRSKLFEDTSLEEALPAASGKSWKFQRKLTLDAFRNFGVGRNSFEGNIAKEANTMLEVMNQYQGEAFDPRTLLGNCMTNVICSVVFGKQYDHSDPEFERFLKIIGRVTTSMGSGGIMLFIPIMSYILPKQYKECTTSLTDLTTFVKQIVEEHQQAFDGNNINDVLDVFLNEIEQADDEKKEYIHDKSITASAVFLFLVGTDAPFLSLQWVLLYMISYPDVQTRVQQEIDSVVGRNQLPQWTHRSALPYTEAVLREVQRIQTVLPLGSAHVASADTTLCGYGVPQGSIIVPNVWAVHNDPTVWTNPDQFKPERFLDENGKLLYREELMPFGAGHRICIGENMAKMELFIFFSYMLHQFNFRTPHVGQPYSLKGIGGMTVSPVPYQIIAEKR